MFHGLQLILYSVALVKLSCFSQNTSIARYLLKSSLLVNQQLEKKHIVAGSEISIKNCRQQLKIILNSLFGVLIESCHFQLVENLYHVFFMFFFYANGSNIATNYVIDNEWSRDIQINKAHQAVLTYDCIFCIEIQLIFRITI